VETPAPDYIVGLDLGQSADYTAAAVLTRGWVREPDAIDVFTAHYTVSYLKRWQLHTAYTSIVSELAELVETPPLSWPLLAVDQTGVGRAVVDLTRPRTYRVMVFRQELGGFNSGPEGIAGIALVGASVKRGSGHILDMQAYQNDVLKALAQTGGASTPRRPVC
jgi:hypothetical protein